MSQLGDTSGFAKPHGLHSAALSKKSGTLMTPDEEHIYPSTFQNTSLFLSEGESR